MHRPQILVIFAPVINAAIFASGEGSNAENLFRHFAGDTRIRFKLVLSNHAEAGVVKRAEKYNKTVHIVSRESLEKYSTRLVEFLQLEKIELIVLAGFLLKIPDEFLQAFPGRIINVHPSLLPKHGGKGMYGKRVHQAVLDSGDRTTGATVHLVNGEYDKGEILEQASCAVEPGDTAETLSQKVRELEFQVLPKAVEKFL